MSAQAPAFRPSDASLAAAGIVLTDLQPLIDGAPPACGAPSIDAMSVEALVAHIVERHHTYTRDAIARLVPLAEKVARVHYAGHPELLRVRTLVQALADAATRPVEVSPVLEATTLGAAFLAGMAVGTWDGWDDIAGAWQPREIIEPARAVDRDRWREARRRAAGWFGDLSALDF